MKNGETVKLLAESHSKEVLLAAGISACAFIIHTEKKISMQDAMTYAQDLIENILDKSGIVLNACMESI